MGRAKKSAKKGARAAKAAAPLSLVAHLPPEPFPHVCLPFLRRACVVCGA